MTEGPGAERVADRKSAVQSLSKGLRILETIAQSDAPLTLSEIGRGSGLDAGTCFRMLNTLVEDGYVKRLEGRRFALTLKVLDLGHRAIARRDVRDMVRPFLRALVSDTSEAASFAVLEGHQVLYVERVRAGFARLGVDIQIGTTIPAHTSVIGRAILAYLPSERLAAIKAASKSDAEPRLDPGLDEELQRIREKGYYLASSLIQNGLLIIAAPVLDADGRPVGAISVAAPSVRASLEDLQRNVLGPLLVSTRDLGRAFDAGGIIAMVTRPW
ncbi:IclR family transcriptional regulator [Aquabacter sp. CN5-332]|uniref:IclR family transcriptional regulator n=1 Tax=Aquabacter sp. CN5-332 TaxID=3156608 RepID=UPI0032B5B084